MRTYTAAVTFGGKQFTDTETEVIAARGHSWGAWTQTKAPTCTAEGEEQRICANDPSHTQTRAVDELGHDRIRHEAKAPTCTEIGWEAYDTCSRCDYTTYREISAKGHTAGASVRENEKAPTCTEEGSYDEVVYCTVCEEELSRKTVTIDAAGHMAAVVEGKEATCTESGLTDGEKCSVCGETLQKQEEIPARGHGFGEWSVTEEAGIGREGEEQRTCSRCGETETRVIPAEAFPVWAIVLHVLLGILLVGGAAVLVIVVKRKKQA